MKGTYDYDGNIIKLLHYAWDIKFWYIGYKGRVYGRSESKIKKLMADGKLVKIGKTKGLFI